MNFLSWQIVLLIYSTLETEWMWMSKEFAYFANIVGIDPHFAYEFGFSSSIGYAQTLVVELQVN